MSEFNQAKYIQNYQKEKYERCVFDVPKGTRKPLQDLIKAQYGKSLAEYVKGLICNDLCLADLSELISEQNSNE